MLHSSSAICSVPMLQSDSSYQPPQMLLSVQYEGLVHGLNLETGDHPRLTFDGRLYVNSDLTRHCSCSHSYGTVATRVPILSHKEAKHLGVLFSKQEGLGSSPQKQGGPRLLWLHS